MYNSISREADKEKVKQVVDLVLSSEEYSFENLLKELNLFKNADVTGDSFFMECPFHKDYSPSMRVSLEQGIYKCFSCGSGGGYFKFLVDYHKHVLNDGQNYYSIIEDILKRDRKLQLSLGFNSIFKEVNKVNISKFKLRRFDVKSINDKPENYIELANKVLADKTKTERDIILMLTSMQSGLDIKYIYNELYGDNKSYCEVNKLDLDFSAILSE